MRSSDRKKNPATNQAKIVPIIEPVLHEISEDHHVGGVTPMKDVIMQHIEDQVKDIEEYESYLKWNATCWLCCVLNAIVGIILVMYAMGVTNVFKSNTPKELSIKVVVLAFAGIEFFPFLLFLRYFICPSSSERQRRRDMVRKKREREAVEDKRRRYLYSVPENGDEDDYDDHDDIESGAPVSKKQRKANNNAKQMQIKAQINAAAAKSKH